MRKLALVGYYDSAINGTFVIISSLSYFTEPSFFAELSAALVPIFSPIVVLWVIHLFLKHWLIHKLIPNAKTLEVSWRSLKYESNLQPRPPSVKSKSTKPVISRRLRKKP